MNLEALIKYFEAADMPPFPIKYSIHAMAGPDFVAIQTELAQEGSPHALARLNELRNYLENEKKKSKTIRHTFNKKKP